MRPREPQLQSCQTVGGTPPSVLRASSCSSKVRSRGADVSNSAVASGRGPVLCAQAPTVGCLHRRTLDSPIDVLPVIAAPFGRSVRISPGICRRKRIRPGGGDLPAVQAAEPTLSLRTASSRSQAWMVFQLGTVWDAIDAGGARCGAVAKRAQRDDKAEEQVARLARAGRR